MLAAHARGASVAEVIAASATRPRRSP